MASFSYPPPVPFKEGTKEWYKAMNRRLDAYIKNFEDRYVNLPDTCSYKSEYADRLRLMKEIQALRYEADSIQELGEIIRDIRFLFLTEEIDDALFDVRKLFTNSVACSAITSSDANILPSKSANISLPSKSANISLPPVNFLIIPTSGAASLPVMHVFIADAFLIAPSITGGLTFFRSFSQIPDAHVFTLMLKSGVFEEAKKMHNEMPERRRPPPKPPNLTSTTSRTRSI